MMTTTMMKTNEMPANEASDLFAELRAINEYGRVSNALRYERVRPSLPRAIWQAITHNAHGERLSREQHNLIHSYVAGQTEPTADSDRFDIPGPLSNSERVLLEFVGELIQQPYIISDKQLERLQAVGWTDTQIAEAVYDTNFFHLMSRIDHAIPARRVFSQLPALPTAA